MKLIKRSDINDTYLACPYCYGTVSETHSPCCGEAGHAEQAHEIDGIVYLDSETVIID